MKILRWIANRSLYNDLVRWQVIAGVAVVWIIGFAYLMYCVPNDADFWPWGILAMMFGFTSPSPGPIILIVVILGLLALVRHVARILVVRRHA